MPFALAIFTLALLRPVTASCEVETFDGKDTCYTDYWITGDCGIFMVEASGCWLDISEEQLDFFNALQRARGGNTIDDNHICCATSTDDCCDPNGGLIAGLVIAFVVFLTGCITLCCYCCTCCPLYQRSHPPPPPVQTGMVVMGQPTVMQPAQPYGAQQEYAVQQDLSPAPVQQQPAA